MCQHLMGISLENVGFIESLYNEIAGTFNKIFISFISIRIKTQLKFNNSTKSKFNEVFITTTPWQLNSY